jgi:hypothetical protein
MVMTELTLVEAVVNSLRHQGFKVATEVANFYRSADIGALDTNGNVWVVECKLSNISQAITQSKTHQLAADKVFIATIERKSQNQTLERIKAAGLGLIYVDYEGNVSKPVTLPCHKKPWILARERLLRRIEEAHNDSSYLSL